MSIVRFSSNSIRWLPLLLVLAVVAGIVHAAPKSRIPSDSDAARSGPGHPWQPHVSGVNVYALSKQTAIPLLNVNTARDLGIIFTLHHSSNGLFGNAFLGAKWRHTYDVRLLRWQEAGNERGAVVFGNHLIKMFELAGGQWQNSDGYRDRLRETEFGYELTRKDGMRFLFAPSGTGRNASEFRLESITFRTSVVDLIYDSTNRLVSVEFSGGRRIALTYTSKRISSIAFETPTGVAQRFLLNYNGGQLRRIGLPPVTTDSGIRDYSYGVQYDQNGQIVALADPMGNISDINYSNGLLAGIRSPGNSLAEQTVFSAAGGSRTITDPTGSAEEFEFDQSARLIRRQDALGNDTVYSFNDQEYEFGVSKTTLPSITKYEWDFDYNGNIVGKIDPAGARWDYSYDSNNNLTRILDPLVTDAAGGIESHRRQTDFVYDFLGRIIEIRRFTDATNFLSEFLEYDPSGNLIERRDPLGNSWSFEYDAYGNMTRLATPEGRTRSWLYEDASTTAGFAVPNAVIDGNGQRVELDRDEWGRLRAVEANTTTLKSFSYDALNRLVSGANNNRVRTFEYDANGHLVRESYDGGTTSYEYLPNGLLASTTDDTPGGTDVEILSYNARGDVTSVNHNGNISHFYYNAEGRRISSEFSNGSASNFGYLQGRLVDSVYLDSVGTVIMGFQYSYQEDGRLKQAIENGGGETAATRYFYDLPYRSLRREDRDGIQVSYENFWTHDGAGRMASFNHNGVNGTYERDNDGLILSIISPQPAVSGYDGNGRLTSQVQSGEELSFEYSTTGDLITINKLNSGQGQFLPHRNYRYDAFGSRLGRTEFGIGTPNGESRYRYAGGRLSRVDAVLNGNLESRRFTRIGSNVTEIQTDGESRSLITDGLTNVRSFTHPNGQSAGVNAVFDADGSKIVQPTNGLGLAVLGGIGAITEGDGEFIWMSGNRFSRPKYGDIKLSFDEPTGNGCSASGRRYGTVTILDQDCQTEVSRYNFIAGPGQPEVWRIGAVQHPCGGHQKPIILRAWDLDNDGIFGAAEAAFGWDLNNDGRFSDAGSNFGWDLDNDGFSDARARRLVPFIDHMSC